MTASTDIHPTHKVRPFYWSVRRELWENRSIYIAPLAVAAVILAGYLFSVRFLPHFLQMAATAAPHTMLGKQAHFATEAPFEIAAAAIMVNGLIVGAFYALGALHGERRDRTVLFWKSLPVSDLTTVLSKVATVLLVLPIATIATAMTTVLVMLVTIPYGMAVVSLWYAPIVGWFMVFSAWAKRMTFIWAVVPPAALCLFERIAFGTAYLWRFLLHRLAGGFDVGFTVKGDQMITSFDELDPVAVVTSLDIWGGLVFLAACVAVCVWLRRRRDPI
jgi:ABC-2 type transport system permease protein